MEMFLKLENGSTFNFYYQGDDIQIKSYAFITHKEEWYSIYTHKSETFKDAVTRKANELSSRFESKIFFLN